MLEGLFERFKRIHGLSVQDQESEGFNDGRDGSDMKEKKKYKLSEDKELQKKYF